MRKKMIAALAVVGMVMTFGIVQAGAIAVETGNGEATTVNDPAATQGGGPNAEGGNPAHGPSCAFFEAETGGAFECARHPDHPGDGAAAPGLDNPWGQSIGAWNSVWQSSPNSAVCGIWATDAEAEAAGEPGAPTCETEWR